MWRTSIHGHFWPTDQPTDHPRKKQELWFVKVGHSRRFTFSQSNKWTCENVRMSHSQPIRSPLDILAGLLTLTATGPARMSFCCNTHGAGRILLCRIYLNFFSSGRTPLPQWDLGTILGNPMRCWKSRTPLEFSYLMRILAPARIPMGSWNSEGPQVFLGPQNSHISWNPHTLS